MQVELWKYWTNICQCLSVPHPHPESAAIPSITGENIILGRKKEWKWYCLHIRRGRKKKEVGRCGFPDGEILEEEYQKEKERSGISVCFSYTFLRTEGCNWIIQKCMQDTTCMTMSPFI